MSLPVLYSFRRCPYAMRARLALHVSGVRVEQREVDLKNKPAAMLALSPKGTVPVLVLAEGRVIDESWDIMQWALQQHDPSQWLPQSDALALNTRTLVTENDGPFKRALDRYKYPGRYGLASGVSMRDEGAQFLSRLDQEIRRNGHVVSARWSVADAAIAPFVRQFAHTDRDWFAAQPWPHLHRWLDQFEQSAAFQHIMQKLPLQSAAIGS